MQGLVAIAPHTAEAEYTESFFQFAQSGRLARRCELLRVEAKLQPPGPGQRRQLRFQYFKRGILTTGSYTFEPTDRVTDQFWNPNEMVAVWDDAAYVAGARYTVPNEQAAQAQHVLRVTRWLPELPAAADGASRRKPAARKQQGNTTTAPAEAAGAAAEPARGGKGKATRRVESGGDGASGAAEAEGERPPKQRRLVRSSAPAAAGALGTGRAPRRRT